MVSGVLVMMEIDAKKKRQMQRMIKDRDAVQTFAKECAWQGSAPDTNSAIRKPHIHSTIQASHAISAIRTSHTNRIIRASSSNSAIRAPHTNSAIRAFA